MMNIKESPNDLPSFTVTSPARTKTGRLRELLEEIEAAQTAGWRIEKIVEALRGQALDLSVDYIKNALKRLRAERRNGKNQKAVKTAESAPEKEPQPVEKSPGEKLGKRDGESGNGRISADGFRDPVPTFTRDIHRRINLDE
ncbi:hypothetical protein AYM40_37810 (plasmid) [Paraburkholderia phytofirmans OLGA172]|uniref:Uncharacterized protein n=1 Tax=Paraburkholderia phytofirmans OLGA172 TaxID=1417228 RepID=A0A167WSS2_9BURK|nr:hypothetical protein [Paraburkholderia phytofirmans]ANB78125.1 hypothetical protein AYM40_37810 [Paraburkholderia phytofirmans OLGA172]